MRRDRSTLTKHAESPNNWDRESGPVALVRARAWLVADALVAERLTNHPVLPVTSVEDQRTPRLLAFVLGMIAATNVSVEYNTVASIAEHDLALDIPELSTRLTMPAREIEAALRMLWISGVLIDAPITGHVRLATQVVPSSTLAAQVHWPEILRRLTQPSRTGTQTALLLLRSFIDRVPHVATEIAFPNAAAARALALGEDQVRRGVRALLDTNIWTLSRASGRASHYRLTDDVLLGVPSLPADIAAPSPSVLIPTASADNPAATGLTIQVGGRTIIVPPSIRDVRLPDGASGAAFTIDPATGECHVRLT